MGGRGVRLRLGFGGQARAAHRIGAPTGPRSPLTNNIPQQHSCCNGPATSLSMGAGATVSAVEWDPPGMKGPSPASGGAA
jgi:hypothetical protein